MKSFSPTKILVVTAIVSIFIILGIVLDYKEEMVTFCQIFLNNKDIGFYTYLSKHHHIWYCSQLKGLKVTFLNLSCP